MFEAVFRRCISDIPHFVIILQDDRYSKYVGGMAIVPLTYGRHVPIIADKVNHPDIALYLQ